MILSRSSQYALELILYLTQHEKPSFIPLNEIAREQGLSFYFLSKITQIMVQEGIVRTYRGPNGGVSLARPADQISIFDVIRAIEGEEFTNQCILRPLKCSQDNPCPIHSAWEQVRIHLEKVLTRTTMDSFNSHELKERELVFNEAE